MTDTLLQRIEEQPVEGKPLGRHIEHDPRSRDHAFGVVLAPSSLRTVVHRRYGAVLDQGQLGSCTGNAMAGAINTSPLHTTREHLLREAEAVGLYELATQLDGFDGTYPPDDTGSSGLAVAKAAVQKGYIGSYQHAFTTEEALAALQIGPVLCGINWYEGFDHPSLDGLVQIAGQVRGGHEIEALGFHLGRSIDESLIELENSWSSAWGRRGRFFFSVKTLRQLQAEQGDVTILVK